LRQLVVLGSTLYSQWAPASTTNGREVVALPSVLRVATRTFQFQIEYWKMQWKNASFPNYKVTFKY
jgi:hypothetical protein